MASLAAVRTVLVQRMEELVLDPSIEVAYPEPPETLKPPPTDRYLEVSLFSNAPRFEGMSLSDGVLDQGLLQVTIVWPKNHGLDEPLKVADAVRAHFAAQQSLFGAGVKVKITGQPWIASPLTDPSEVRIPVTIPWTA